jgi:ElaB/YqjD/DUF883 family membrane-anchored ribosome-binding protein
MMNAGDEAMQKEMDSLRSDLAQLRGDMSDLMKSVNGLASSVGADVSAKLREKTGHARARAEQAAQTVVHEIEERPLVSVLGAFIVGLILGLLLTLRRH